jgi:ATP-dependent helicase HrpB
MERGRNTLYVSRISLANAAQRTGRAGRTGSGVCVRLWSKTAEQTMRSFLAPEISRLDISGPVLIVNAICGFEGKRSESVSLPWLTQPSNECISHALESLRRSAAFGPGADSHINTAKETPDRIPIVPLSDTGRSMAFMPLEPQLASILLRCENRALIYLREQKNFPATGTDAEFPLKQSTLFVSLNSLRQTSGLIPGSLCLFR